MDIPAVVMICACAFPIALAFGLWVLKVPRLRAIGILFFSVLIVWLLASIVGENVFPWGGNAMCSRFLGCITGFAGYDAFEHLLFGVVGTLGTIWVSLRFPKYSILNENPWKSALIIVSFVALLSVSWEVIECIKDAVRLDILHEPILDFRLHINYLEQPSNIDTMGDLVFAGIGSIGALILALKNEGVVQ